MIMNKPFEHRGGYSTALAKLSCILLFFFGFCTLQAQHARNHLTSSLDAPDDLAHPVTRKSAWGVPADSRKGRPVMPAPFDAAFSRDWEDLFEEPEFFEERGAVIQSGIGIRSTVDLEDQAAALDQVDVKPLFPAVNLTVERQVWRNFGAGLTLGTQFWTVPVLKYQYRYYTGGLRAAYHFNITDKLDPYLGVGATYRLMQLTNTERNISESMITAHFIAGARYYLTDVVGAYLEVGGHSTSWFNLGLCFYIP